MAARYGDPDRVFFSFALVVALEALTQVIHIHPHDRIYLRIEVGVALQDIQRNAIFGYLVSLSKKRFFTNIGKKA